jgi:hypothetical protein
MTSRLRLKDGVRYRITMAAGAVTLTAVWHARALSFAFAPDVRFSVDDVEAVASDSTRRLSRWHAIDDCYLARKRRSVPTRPRVVR